MTFRYSTGLANVGSYQVSGRPWCKHFTTVGATKGLIEFPNVVQNLFAHFDDNAGGHTIKFAFCEPRRSVNMPNSNEYLSTSIASTREVTLSMWVKFDSLSAGDKRIANFTGTGIDIRVQTRSTDEIRTFINSGSGISVEDTTTSPLAINEWFNMVFVVKSGDTKVYLNGVLLTETINTEAITADFDTLDLGSSSANHDGSYSNIYLFNRALTEVEVAKVYNGSYKTSPNSGAAISGLISWWAFEDNQYKTFFATPDTTTTIFDRISSNNLVINTGALIFEDGYQLDNALDRHSIELSGHEQTIITAKIKQIFYSTSNSSEFSICASLTNIPAEKMHELTGPGIDE